VAGTPSPDRNRTEETLNAMRRLAISVLLAALASACWAAGDETVDQLKARLENARPEDRIGVCLQIAHQQIRNADKFYSEGNVERGHAAVEDIVTYSKKAGDDAAQSNKHLKNVEISVRKLAEKLRDIKRTLALEDQPPIEKAIEGMEAIRTTLLKEMFRKEKKK
jgi:soluble cytochrome b562